MIKIDCIPYSLRTSVPFGTAHGSRTHTDIILLRVSDGKYIGYGEGSMPPYYDENQQSMLDFIKNVDFQRLLEMDSISAIHKYLETLSDTNTAAKAAIDIACHDLIAKRNGSSVTAMYNLQRPDFIKTSHTIGYASIEDMAKETSAKADLPILKVKLVGEGDIERLQMIRSIYDGEIWIDANQGWSVDILTDEFVSALEKANVKLIEQPFRKGDLKSVKHLSAFTQIPIIADEDCQRLSDIDQLGGVYDGINIKLMKCTGIYEATKMISHARERGMSIMLGCMTESSIAISAAMQIAPLVDYCDLDGNHLINNDPASGMCSDDMGHIYYSDQRGIGAEISPDIFC